MHDKLGQFIRLHRERTRPRDVGLPDGGRRRTPGLRREELAQLCGVSPTWLTWIEQGRPVSVSAKVLARLAELLNLTTAERAYLFRLADKLDPALPQQTHPAAGIDAAAIVRAIKAPAYVLDRQWNAVAWNDQAQTLFVGWLDTAAHAARPAAANLLRFMFLEPCARTLISDWTNRAQRLVAEFRAECGKHADREPWAGMIETLARDSAEFKRMWASQHVLEREGGVRQFAHPTKGLLTFEQVTFDAASGRGLKLVMLLRTRSLR